MRTTGWTASHGTLLRADSLKGSTLDVKISFSVFNTGGLLLYSRFTIFHGYDGHGFVPSLCEFAVSMRLNGNHSFIVTAFQLLLLEGYTL